MLDIVLQCPTDRLPMEKNGSNFSCPKCGRNFHTAEGVLITTDKTSYWGEITQAAMEDLLREIQTHGFQEGMTWLASHFPGRERFVLDVGRADWRVALDLKPGQRALDLGCGLGSTTFVLASLGLDVVAVDLSKERVAFVKARQQAEAIANIFPMVGDAYNLPFPDESFDLIVCNGLLEWIAMGHNEQPPQKIQHDFLVKMYRLLRPGGTLYIGIENRWALAYWKGGRDHSGLPFTSLMPRRLASRLTLLVKKTPYTMYTYGHHGYLKMFRQAGFNATETYIPYPGYNRPTTLIPYQAAEALNTYITSRLSFKKLPKWARVILKLFWQARWYRWLSYSYCFYLHKK